MQNRWVIARNSAAIKSFMLCGVLLASGLLTGCGGKADLQPVVPPPAPGPRAIIKTKFGEIHLKFYPDMAPNHVANFIKLAKSGFYDGTIFHRVIPGFMIQGGDPNTKNSLRKETYGQGGPKDEKGNAIYLKAEFSETPHKRGIVSMARASDPDSADTSFFIVLGPAMHLDGKYTIFGKVVDGFDTIELIEKAPRHGETPDQRIELIDATIKQ